MKKLWKSTTAVLTGFVTVFLLTTIFDIMMEKIGIMDINFYNNAMFVQLFVTAYRCVLIVLGSYITARIAPNHPMKHALILGSIGLLLTIVGSIVMWDAAPAWYNLALILTALPCAWLGGKLYQRSRINIHGYKA